MIVFLTRSGCALCDAGERIVRRVARWYRLDMSVRRVGAADRYAERVPVVLGPDGSVLLEGRWTWWQAARALRTVRRSIRTSGRSFDAGRQ